MRGRRVERRFGWDCHGLPAEMEAEKELKISGREAITAFGIDKYNDACRKRHPRRTVLRAMASTAAAGVTMNSLPLPEKATMWESDAVADGGAASILAWAPCEESPLPSVAVDQARTETARR